MIINLTKLLDIDTRVVYVTKPLEGTTADTRFLKKEPGTADVSPYSFMNDSTAGHKKGD